MHSVLFGTHNREPGPYSAPGRRAGTEARAAHAQRELAGDSNGARSRVLTEAVAGTDLDRQADRRALPSLNIGSWPWPCRCHQRCHVDANGCPALEGLPASARAALMSVSCHRVGLTLVTGLG
jgi:hypothetical protein